MRILFLCGSLESGKDGVGDYTARLAVELRSEGNDCLCVAIDDRQIEQDSGENGFLESLEFQRVDIRNFTGCPGSPGKYFFLPFKA